MYEMPQRALTIRELVELHLRHARVYYRRKDGTPTREHLNVRTALERFAAFAGEGNLGERINRHQLRAWIDQLVAEDLSRPYINACLDRVRRCLHWCVNLDYLPTSILTELQAVRRLPPHRSPAREPEPRPTPPLDHPRQVLPELPPHARDVLRLVTLTGARISEILEAKSSEVVNDELGPRLVRAQHKTAHHGRTRTIPLNKQAWAIVERRYKPLCPDDYLFPAMDAGNRRGHYTADAFRRTLARACKRAGVPVFTPQPVRHAVARRVRDERGLDEASALLGHSKISMTEYYAPLDFARARRGSEVLN